MSENARVRIGDVERSNAVAQLEQHAAAGRLSPEELEHRRSLARSAVYESDLEPLFGDLPGGFQQLSAPTWQTWTPQASGVSDGPATSRPYADPLEDLNAPGPSTGPVVSGEVYDEYGEVTPRPTMRPARPRSAARTIWWVLAILVFAALIIPSWHFGHGWYFFLWFPFIFPLFGGRNRRR